jgi:hypothetical protein
VLYLLLFDAGSSVSAAALFAVILVGAWAIVLVPVFICLLCASEQLERRWLCRRYPLLEACLGYREALEEYGRRRHRRRLDRADLGWWTSLSSAVYRFEIERRLAGADVDLVTTADRETAGYDFEVAGSEGRLLIRCEPGGSPVGIGVGRELVSCLAETGADRAMVVTAAGASPGLADYLSGRSLVVVDPIGLSV